MLQTPQGRKELIVNNLFKILRILALISLLALPITSCLEGSMVLILTVDTPQEKATVSTPTVTVSGTVTKTAEVKVNDVAVPSKGGKFSTEIKLTEGINVIDVVAKSGKDVERKTVTITYNPSK
jgi:hypothetical protein